MEMKFVCDQCDAFGIISIQNDDSDYHTISVCPCCGAEPTISEIDDE